MAGTESRAERRQQREEEVLQIPPTKNGSIVILDDFIKRKVSLGVMFNWMDKAHDQLTKSAESNSPFAHDIGSFSALKRKYNDGLFDKRDMVIEAKDMRDRQVAEQERELVLNIPYTLEGVQFILEGTMAQQLPLSVLNEWVNNRRDHMAQIKATNPRLNEGLIGIRHSLIMLEEFPEEKELFNERIRGVYSFFNELSTRPSTEVPFVGRFIPKNQ